MFFSIIGGICILDIILIIGHKNFPGRLPISAVACNGIILHIGIQHDVAHNLKFFYISCLKASSYLLWTGTIMVTVTLFKSALPALIKQPHKSGIRPPARRSTVSILDLL